MSVVIDQSTILGIVHAVGYTAQAAGSWGSQDITNLIITNADLPFVNVVELDTTALITTGFNTYYKLEGYNPVTGLYETWHSKNVLLLSPPSGHTLQNVTLLATWIDR